MRFLILLALLSTAFAVPKTVNRIVGGEITQIEDYPFMSNMQFGQWSNWWYQACGGTLISSDTVLSAAHCYEGDSPAIWRVRLGSSYRSSGGTLYDVSKIIMHENYDPSTVENDVAIIKLFTPAAFSNSVSAARIAGTQYILPDDALVYSAGWGDIDNYGPSSEDLRHVGVNVINQELCAERYAYLKTLPGLEHWPDVTDGMLCAGILDVGGKDACQGDSGGPLVHEGDILVGVTSWGYGCAHEMYPGVNARVSYYSDWIVENGS